MLTYTDPSTEPEKPLAITDVSKQTIASLRRELQEVIADLRGAQCKTAKGRNELARVLETRLRNLK